MKNKRAHELLITIISITLLLAILPATAHTAIPQKINYQGYLTDPQGTAIDGTVSIVFSIYSQASGGTALWAETQTVTVTDGVFNADLGNTTTLNLPFDTPYYLGTTIGSDSEMTPRQPLTSVGYAFRAKEADSVKDNAVTTTVIADDAVITGKVADDAISGDKIAPATITSSNIANGAVGSSQIGDGSITNQDLANNAVTLDKISPEILSSIDGVSNDGGNVDLVAGSNVTITPDDAANKITIASTGGDGSLWTESGGNVYRDSGNVGIGTTSPQVKLSFGTDLFTPRKIALWDGVNDFYGFGLDIGRLTFFTNNTEKMSILDNGNVGIGTINPEQKLHVVGVSQFDVGGGSISFSTPGGWPGMISFSKNGHRRDVHFFDDLMTISLSESDKPPSLSNGIAIMENGNVGIGNTNPAKKLTVRGNLLIQSKSTGLAVAEMGEGLDYAEGFDVSSKNKILPGNVLIIDPDNPGNLTISNKAYDFRVAGIVAGAKGMGSGVRLGASQFDCDVALAGRVYCNVDTTLAGVEPGDLLTTSVTPGYAMKAKNYMRAQGAILGKAMERLPEGEKGQILVLVTLQ